MRTTDILSPSLTIHSSRPVSSTGGGRTLSVSAEEWEALGRLADPKKAGVFEFGPFVRRCQLRVLGCDARHQSGRPGSRTVTIHWGLCYAFVSV